MFLFSSRWSVRIPALPLHLFSRLLRSFFRPSRQTATPLSTVHTFRFSSLIPRDLASSSEMFFPPRPLLPLGCTRCRDVCRNAATAVACNVGFNPRDERESAFVRISHFPRGCRQIGRESLPITHCPLQLKLPDRAREYRLPADRFDISSAVDANLFVATAICSQQSMSAEEISDRSVSRGATIYHFGRFSWTISAQILQSYKMR